MQSESGLEAVQEWSRSAPFFIPSNRFIQELNCCLHANDIHVIFLSDVLLTINYEQLVSVCVCPSLLYSI